MNEITVSVDRMTKDQRIAAMTLDRRQARYFVDSYYQYQEDRIRAAGRVRAMGETEEPHTAIQWLELQAEVIENQLRSALDKYSLSQPIGIWMRSIRGIGPVISAGFLANLDITRTNDDGDIIFTTAGKFNAVCGLACDLDEDGDRRDRRIRGKKLSYNPALKRICWIAGECFKRLGSADDDAYYRHVYDQRKFYEQKKNLAGDYADQCAEALRSKDYSKDTLTKQWYAGTWVRNPALNPVFNAALRELPKKGKGKKQTKADIAEQIVDAAVADEIEDGRKLRDRFDPKALAELDAKFPDQPCLPPAHIDRRAARYAVKLFISHLHAVWWHLEFPSHDGKSNYPAPYAVGHLRHRDIVTPPNLHVVGLDKVKIYADPPT